jgi:hypothetical protein
MVTVAEALGAGVVVGAVGVLLEYELPPPLDPNAQRAATASRMASTASVVCSSLIGRILEIGFILELTFIAVSPGL